MDADTTEGGANIEDVTNSETNKDIVIGIGIGFGLILYKTLCLKEILCLRLRLILCQT